MAMNTNYMTDDGGGGGYSSRHATSAALASSRRKKKYDWESYMRTQQAENMMASGSSSGSGSSGSGSGSSGYSDSGDYDGGDDSDGGYSYSEPAFDWAAYYAELQRQAQERANEAYERNMERIASAYNSASGNLKGNYDSTVERLNAARSKSLGDVNSDAEKSLREAYINNMLSRKNLNQRLSAMGYNGGATESTMASLANNYGNSRTDINNTLNDNIGNLDMTYGDNLASALQSYNSAMSNLDLQKMQLEMQAENARQNAEASTMSAYMSMDPSYLTALQSALTNQGNYTYTGTQATNTHTPTNVTQAASASDGANYSKYLAQAQLLANQGNSKQSIMNNLFSAVSSGDLGIDSLYSILNQLGAS